MLVKAHTNEILENILRLCETLNVLLNFLLIRATLEEEIFQLKCFLPVTQLPLATWLKDRNGLIWNHST